MIRNAGLPARVVTTHISALALLFASLAPLAAQSPNAGLVTLPGHVIRALPNATPVPHTPQMDAQPITVTVVLNLSDPAGAAALEQDVTNPNSAIFDRPSAPASSRRVSARPSRPTIPYLTTYNRSASRCPRARRTAERLR